MSEELKPCPFCGGKAEIRTTHYELETKDVPINSYVRCVKCFAQTDEFSYKNTDRTGTNPVESAVNAWNRRASDGRSDKQTGGDNPIVPQQNRR